VGSTELQFCEQQYCIQEQQRTAAPAPLYTMGYNKMVFGGWGEFQLLGKPVILETAEGKQNPSAADQSCVSSLAETGAQRSRVSKHHVLNGTRRAQGV